MSIPRLILLITLSALGGLVVLLMVIDCVGDITAPPPEPTSTPRPRIGDWTGVGAGEMTNHDGLQLRCFNGQPFIYAGPFQRTLYHGEAVPPPLDGGVEAKVVGADGTLVKQFYYSEHPLSPDAENMRAYISNYNNPDPTARPTPKSAQLSHRGFQGFHRCSHVRCQGGNILRGRNGFGGFVADVGDEIRQDRRSIRGGGVPQMRDLTNGICGILCRGAGSRLHGNMKVSAHLRFFLSNFFAEYQSREHATKT